MYRPGAQLNNRMQNKSQKDANFMDQTTKATKFAEMNGRDPRINLDSPTQTTDASTVQETTQPVIVQRDTSIRHLPLATLPVVQVFTTNQIPIFPCNQTHFCPKIHNKVNLQLALQHQPLWLIIPQGNQVLPQALTNHCNTPHNISTPHFPQPPSSHFSPLSHPSQPFNPQILPPYFLQYPPSNSPSMGSENSYLAVIHKQLERKEKQDRERNEIE